LITAGQLGRVTIANRIDTAIRFFIYLLIFWAPYSPAVIESCVITCVVLWIIKRIILCDSEEFKKRRLFVLLNTFKPKQSFLNVPIFLFLGACILSIIGSPFFEISIRAFFTKILEWFVIYFLVIEVFTEKKHVYIALSVFLFTSAAVFIDAIVQFHITHKDIFLGRTIARGGATAAFKHPNSLGGYLTLAIPVFVVSILFSYRKKILKYAFVSFSIMSVWTAVISFSRGAWIAIIGGIIFLMSFINKTAMLWIVLLLIVCLAGIMIFASPYLMQKFRISSENLYSTFEWRKNLWNDSFVMIKDRPFFGHGLNTFMNLFQAYRRSPNVGIFDPTYAHNCYIQIAGETGLFGLACFFGIIAVFFKRIAQFIYGNPVFKEKNLYLLLHGIVAGIFAFLVHSFFDTNLYSLQLSALFWLMVGIAVSIFNILSQPDFYGKKVVQQ